MKLINLRKQRWYQSKFQVVDNDCTVPLIGKSASEAIKLINVYREKIMASDCYCVNREMHKKENGQLSK